MRVLGVNFEQNMAVLVGAAVGAALVLALAGTQADKNARRSLWAARRTTEFATKADLKKTATRTEKRAVQAKARRAAVYVADMAVVGASERVAHTCLVLFCAWRVTLYFYCTFPVLSLCLCLSLPLPLSLPHSLSLATS